jgi:uncharacterized protein involved in copper resistance
MTMYAKTGAVVIAMLVAAGCSGSERPAEEDAATASVQGADTAVRRDSAGASGMAGMDHSNMAGMDHGNMPGMQDDSQAAGAQGMAGMDHSNMPGMSSGGGAAGMDHSRMPGMRAGSSAATSMAGMDHSRMGGVAGQTSASASRGGTPAMDHSQMSGMQGMDHSRMQAAGDPSRAAPPAAGRMAEMDHSNMNMPGRTPTIQGMDHANMPGMQPGAAATMPMDDAGMEKLRALVAELVQDSMVQAQIQTDPALRRRWADEGVRRVLLNRPSVQRGGPRPRASAAVIGCQWVRAVPSQPAPADAVVAFVVS